MVAICLGDISLSLDANSSSLVSVQLAFNNKLGAAARPFLKWVGGKTQLIRQLDSNFPKELRAGQIRSYIEPFVGGGSIFFHVAQTYAIDRFVLADNNSDLIIAYWTIRERVGSLITTLHDLQTRYLRCSEKRREDFYYKTRSQFNRDKAKLDIRNYSDAWIERTAQLIFLNKTCFNGLFRVNSAGLFNVAFGKYVQPKICDSDNLVLVAHLLKRAEILLGDFESVLDFVQSDSFIYLDPPYRPLTETANFTAYSPTTFTALDQQRLAALCNRIHSRGAKLLMSNSDPTNIDPSDSFFEQTYPGFHIVKATANRMVNCRADRRGKISELLLMNYSDVGR